MRGKNINMFLMDGTPTGRIKCTIANWTGVAYKISRADLELCKNRNDLKQSGVYFLFGASNDTGKPVAYIGQAGNRKNGEGILNRLFEHKRNADKDYWTEAVVFTTSNNSFGPTEISFLENRFCNLAINANRYEVKNGNDPSPGHITEEKESEMEEFVDLSRIIMGTLGHNIFEPITESPSNTTPTVKNTPPVENDETLFYLTRKIKAADFTVKAVGKLRYLHNNIFGTADSEGEFVVLKGSIISPLVKDVVSDKVKNRRKSVKISEDWVLLEDVDFSSPSGAGEFVTGTTCNGWRAWKNKDGVELRYFVKE